MRTQSKRWLLGILSALLFGLFALSLPLWDTRGDRERLLARFSPPEDFELLAIESGGSRSGLFNDGPETIALYSAPWYDGRLCERLKEVTRALSSTPMENSERYPTAACAYFTWVPSGWAGRLVNEWRYAGVVRAYPPGYVPTSGWRARDLPPTLTLVMIELSAKIGH